MWSKVSDHTRCTTGIGSTTGAEQLKVGGVKGRGRGVGSRGEREEGGREKEKSCRVRKVRDRMALDGLVEE